MAIVQIPGQNIAAQVPDEGQVFRGVDGNAENTVFVRRGQILYQIPKNQYQGDFNSLPKINPGNEGIALLKQNSLLHDVQGTPNVFLPQQVTKGETITLNRGANSNSPLVGISNTSGALRQFGPGPTTTGYISGQAPIEGLDPSIRSLLEKGDQIGQLASKQSGIPYNNVLGQGALGAVDEYIKNQYTQGNVINPNVPITPNVLTDFLTKAQSEIHPYYASQLKLAKDTLLTNLGYSRDEILRQEQQAQQKYAGELRTLGESSAEKGFAQSGIRQREEQQLATNTQNSIDQSRTKLSESTANTARTFAEQYGGSELPQVNIGQTPRVLAGEQNFNTSSQESPLYKLNPDVYNSLIGKQQQEEATGTRSLAQFYENQTREAQSTPTRYF